MNLNEYKILNLIYSKNKSLFFREISKLSGVSIGGTQKVLQDYSYFLKKEIKGRNTYYSFNENILVFYLKKILENEKTMKFLRKKESLGLFFKKIIDENISCLVFGSHVRSMENSESDLDLIVLSNKKIPEYLSNLKLHIINLGKKDFENIFKKKEPLSLEILKDHVIINGFDFFMEVFEKYGKN